MHDIIFVLEMMGIALATIVVLFAGYAKLGAISSKKQK